MNLAETIPVQQKATSPDTERLIKLIEQQIRSMTAVHLQDMSNNNESRQTIIDHINSQLMRHVPPRQYRMEVTFE